MNFILIGHVNHGKSTLARSLLYNSNTVDKRVINRINKNADELKCQNQWLAHLSDINDDERTRGKTLELNKISFEYQNKKIVLYDSPGHRSLIREMVMGCSLANLPILVISIRDYKAGLSGQTLEHTVIARCTSSSLIVCWNKMDSIQWNTDIYNSVITDFTKRINRLKFKQVIHVPISALFGHLFVRYKNKIATMTLIEAMNNISIPQCKTKMIKAIDNKVHGRFIIYHVDNILSPGFKCVLHANNKIHNAEIVNIKNGKLNFVTLKNAKEKLIHITLKIDTDYINNNVILRKNDNTVAVGMLDD